MERDASGDEKRGIWVDDHSDASQPGLDPGGEVFGQNDDGKWQMADGK
jgi:hypothetical protein